MLPALLPREYYDKVMLKSSNKNGARLAETTLHNQLKTCLAAPGDEIESPLDGYFIDILRGDLLIEIQTRSFSSLRRKLTHLLLENKVLVIHPIPLEKWILRKSRDPKNEKQRKSPKKGKIEDLFNEMIYIPDLISHPNFSLEILLTREVEIWEDSGNGSWRRKGWQITDRRLLSIEKSRIFASPADYRDLLPVSLPQPFTTLDLSECAHIPRHLAQKMAYCLNKNGIIRLAGKKGRSHLYTTQKPERVDYCFP